MKTLPLILMALLLTSYASALDLGTALQNSTYKFTPAVEKKVAAYIQEDFSKLTGITDTKNIQVTINKVLLTNYLIFASITINGQNYLLVARRKV